MTPKRRWWKRKIKEADPLTQNQRIEVDSAEPTATGNAANLVGSHENEVVEAKNEEKEVELT
jgi:hypothetical protein